MSKAIPTTTSAPIPAPHNGGKRSQTAAARQNPRSPASTQDLIAQMWETLEWRKTLQMALIIAITGITVTLMLAGLGLLAHSMPSLTVATWPVSVSITGTVSYQIARRRRR